MTTTRPLTDDEAAAFREKTTRVLRQRFAALRGKGEEPKWSRLVGGPLDGVPNLQPSSVGLLGWCYPTERGLFVASYRYDEASGEWRFANVFVQGEHAA